MVSLLARMHRDGLTELAWNKLIDHVTSTRVVDRFIATVSKAGLLDVPVPDFVLAPGRLQSVFVEQLRAAVGS